MGKRVKFKMGKKIIAAVVSLALVVATVGVLPVGVKELKLPARL